MAMKTIRVEGLETAYAPAEEQSLALDGSGAGRPGPVRRSGVGSARQDTGLTDFGAHGLHQAVCNAPGRGRRRTRTSGRRTSKSSEDIASKRRPTDC